MLGVLGGMGPMATLDFVSKVIRHTPAQRDQDHIPMIVSLAAEIPDRTDAILGIGPDPFSAMRDALRGLEAAGADCIAIPCNTAHHWHGALQAETEVPILNIVEAVLEALPGGPAGRIGILATTGTLKAGIYQHAFDKRRMDWLVPDEHRQGEVMRAVRLVKGGDIQQATGIMKEQTEALLAAGCRHVAMACTEIPIALAGANAEFGEVLVDATDALAVASVKMASDICKRARIPLAA